MFTIALLELLFVQPIYFVERTEYKQQNVLEEEGKYQCYNQCKGELLYKIVDCTHALIKTTSYAQPTTRANIECLKLYYNLKRTYGFQRF